MCHSGSFGIVAQNITRAVSGGTSALLAEDAEVQSGRFSPASSQARYQAFTVPTPSTRL
jgi:hypothetical protein